MAFAHFDGAVFMYLFTAVLLPDLGGAETEVAQEWDLVAFVGYLVVAGSAGGWWCYRNYRRRTDWLRDGEEPTDEQRLGVLRLPLQATVANLVPWLVAALLFGTINAVLGSEVREVFRLSFVIALGGLVTCALSFLMLERVLRPLFALALDGKVLGRHASLGVRPRLLLTWVLCSAVPLGGVAMLTIRSEEADVGAAVVGLAIAGLLAGSIATSTAARSVADPLDEVRAALGRVEDGDLDVRVAVDDGGEVGRLQAGVNQMVDGLRERHRLADLFGRHVGTEVARRALVEGVGLDSEQREASALFVDVIGSTAMAEVLPPQEVVRTLNAFFGAVVAAVSAEGGWVNKFEGDGALCVFGAPAAQPDHAARALRAARELHRRIDDLAAAYPGLDAAVGVSSGPVVAGNVGTEQRYEYTIIGRPVNEAARLSELAKGRDLRVLASAAAVVRAGGEGARWAARGTVGLRGQQAPTAIYEPAVGVSV